MKRRKNGGPWSHMYVCRLRLQSYCYRMRNPKTKKVSETRDVVFLNKIYLQALENTKKSCKKKDPEDTESESILQDKRGIL
jgi:hypothetical protein